MHAALALFLAVAAQQREGQRAQARRRDLLVALLAAPVAAVLEPQDRLVDLLERLALHLHQGEVHFLHEVVDALFLGVAHVVRVHRDRLAQRAKLLVDLAPAVFQHSLEQQVALAVDRFVLACHGIPPFEVRFRPLLVHLSLSATIR